MKNNSITETKEIIVAFRYDDFSSNSPDVVDNALIHAFAQQGVSCTFGVVPFVTAGDYRDSNPCEEIALTETKVQILKKAMANIDILIINDGETREFAKEPNIVRAAQKILKYGPKMIIVKRGEYGAMMFSDNSVFATPAYPLHTINDPTGAGDTFAGGFMGYIASIDRFDEPAIRQGIIFGSVMASFAVEDFSLNRLMRLEKDEIRKRFKEFKKLSHFDDFHETFGI